MALPSTIDAVILAGGQGSRLGGIDKGLMSYHDRPVAAYLKDRVQSMPAFSGQCMVSANRNLEIYCQWFEAVLPDQYTDFPGPLAGIVAALSHTQAEALLVVPCDVPEVPLALLARLLGPFSHENCLASYAVTPEGIQPTVCLISKRLLALTRDRLENQQRQLRGWLLACHAQPVHFADAEAFKNLNLPEDWQKK